MKIWRCQCGAEALSLEDRKQCFCGDIYEESWEQVEVPDDHTPNIFERCPVCHTRMDNEYTQDWLSCPNVMCSHFGKGIDDDYE